MISVSHLTKTFKTPQVKPGLGGFLTGLAHREYSVKKAVDDVSFEIGAGELVGFLGPNGAGKTTTMKMLSGVLYPSGGRVRVLGHVPFEKEREFLRSIAFVMGQRSQLMWELPAMDTFRLNQAIYEIGDESFVETVYTLADLLDARDILSQPAKTLSLGQRMKMELIAALIHKPKVLFLDEPTIGLDVVAQKVVRDFIADYQRLYGATILLTSHYMEDVRRLAERVIIIDHGVIAYDGKLTALLKKYGGKRVVKIRVEEMPSMEILEKVGGKPEVDGVHVSYSVSATKTPELIQRISKSILFSDITIEDEKIEDIVRKIFGGR